METEKMMEMTQDDKINLLFAEVNKLKQEVEALKERRATDSVVTDGMNKAYRDYILSEYGEVKGK